MYSSIMFLVHDGSSLFFFAACAEIIEEKYYVLHYWMDFLYRLVLAIRKQIHFQFRSHRHNPRQELYFVDGTAAISLEILSFSLKILIRICMRTSEETYVHAWTYCIQEERAADHYSSWY